MARIHAELQQRSVQTVPTCLGMVLEWTEINLASGSLHGALIHKLQTLHGALLEHPQSQVLTPQFPALSKSQL